MKTLVIALSALLFSTAVYVSIPAEEEVCKSGICVVEFNAPFNKANSVDWIEELSDCKGKRVDILASPDLQQEHKIVVVPTVIIFNDGEEVERFQGNIMMQLETSQEEVQSAVDEILISWF